MAFFLFGLPNLLYELNTKHAHMKNEILITRAPNPQSDHILWWISYIKATSSHTIIQKLFCRWDLVNVFYIYITTMNMVHHSFGDKAIQLLHPLLRFWSATSIKMSPNCLLSPYRVDEHHVPVPFIKGWVVQLGSSCPKWRTFARLCNDCERKVKKK